MGNTNLWYPVLGFTLASKSPIVVMSGGKVSRKAGVTKQNTKNIDLPSLLRQSAKSLDLRDFPSPALWLQALYLALKPSVTPWNYILFNQAIGLGENNLIGQVIRGTRKLSYQSAQTIALHLDLPESQKKALDIAVKLGLTKDLQKRQKIQEDLDKAKTFHNRKLKGNEPFQFLKSWHHTVVFETIGLFPNGASLTQIAGKLAHPLSQSTLLKSLELLIRLGLVRSCPETQLYFKTSEDIDLGDSIPGMGVLRYHAHMLDLAKDALNELPENKRNISSVTLTCTDSEYAQMVELIQNFQKYLMFMASQSQEPKSQSKVFQFNIQFFPLSKD